MKKINCVIISTKNKKEKKCDIMRSVSSSSNRIVYKFHRKVSFYFVIDAKNCSNIFLENLFVQRTMDFHEHSTFNKKKMSKLNTVCTSVQHLLNCN